MLGGAVSDPGWTGEAEQIPERDVDSSVVLADFSTIAVARDLAPSVKVLTERYADTDELAIRVVTRYDAAPVLPEGIVVIRNAA